MQPGMPSEPRPENHLFAETNTPGLRNGTKKPNGAGLPVINLPLNAKEQGDLRQLVIIGCQAVAARITQEGGNALMLTNSVDLLNDGKALLHKLLVLTQEAREEEI